MFEDLREAEAGLVQLRQQQQTIMTQVLRQEGIVLYLRSRLQEERDAVKQDTENTEKHQARMEQG
jgi:hypothetical protein